ncbi:hypothetical protein GGR50DRAFT_503534 [Xylaria sp. CBS 124048]|nr:hypothetical protein GGR50DRAFT_503534 [Xylaria sp. CBS 124048]
MADETSIQPTAPTGASHKSIDLRVPSKYLPSPSNAQTTIAKPFVAPTNEWLWGTWTVTHSTLSMWRSAQNVRITYSPHNKSTSPAPDTNEPSVNDNLVEYEKKDGRGSVKSVFGIEKPDPAISGAWNWRGKGLLVIASSHWEILGWGERPVAGGKGVERWAVTWFAPTLFTEEGVDIYSDRKEGLSKQTADDIIKALKGLEAPKLTQLVDKQMMEVAISLPWKESPK